MEWDDLKYFLELARTGTLTAAARRLEVQHSTVARRIARLEREQNTPLFVRDFDGYRLNRAGQDLLVRAEQIAAAFAALRPDGSGQDNQLSGVVRIGCTEGFASRLIAPSLSRLRAKYPGIALHLIVTPRAVQLPRNEADIVISIDRPARGPYLIAKLTDYRLGLFASADYLAAHPAPRRASDLRDHEMVSYVAELEPAKDLPRAEDVPHAPPPMVRSTSLAGQKAAVLAGCGIALLPLYFAQGEPQLRQVLADQVSFRKTYFISAAEETRHLPRIASVWQFLRDDFDANRAQPLGYDGQPAVLP